MLGKISDFLEEKGFGFIIGVDKKKYFFHKKAFVKGTDILKIIKGTNLSFDTQTSDQGLVAINMSGRIK
jgi:cold shock CspA family protein